MAQNWIAQQGYYTNNVLTKKYRNSLQPLTKFRQFVDVKAEGGKRKGQTVNWLRVADLGTIGGKIVETNTMNESDFDNTWGTATVDEFGNSVPFTGKVEDLSEFDINKIITTNLRNDTAKVLDGEVERQFNACQLRYVGTTTAAGATTTNGTATATNTSAFNLAHLKNMKTEMETRNVFGVPELGMDYACILSIEAHRGLMDDIQIKSLYVETGYEKLVAGETGRFEGTRLVKDSYASRFVVDTTARTATAKAWTGGYSLDAYFFGEETAIEVVVVPEELRMKIITDYGRSKGIAWYFLGIWKIMWETAADARIIKWDSA